MASRVMLMPQEQKDLTGEILPSASQNDRQLFHHQKNTDGHTTVAKAYPLPGV